MRRSSDPGVSQQSEYFSKLHMKHARKLKPNISKPDGQDAMEGMEGTVRVTVDRPVLRFADCYPPSPSAQAKRTRTINESERKGLRNKIKNWGSNSSVTSVHFPKPDLTAKEKLRKQCRRMRKNYCTCSAFKSFLLTTFPFVSWMKEYKVKDWLVADVVSGVTAAIYQVPQGLGNALLAKVPAVIGLYTSFFPALVYSFLGTSRQTSVGTFTVLSLMMGNVIKNYAHVETIQVANSTFKAITGIKNPHADLTLAPTPLQVATAVAFMSGVVQIILYILRLGKLGVLISPALANGFTAGCAVQTAVSQLKGMFALTFEDYGGTFSVIYTIIAFFSNIHNAHPVSSALSVTVVVVVVVGKDFLGPIFQRKTKFPLPVDIIVVVAATLVSYYMDLNKEYNVAITGAIPQGLPGPIMPSFSIFRMVMSDAIAIGLVTFTSTFSMGVVYAKKYDHKVDANQELLALGASNVISGIFSCIPAAGSIARSSVLESVGTKTQLTSMISSVIMLVVIYFVGPMMSPLPKCVLAATIAIAVKNYCMTIKEIFDLWPVSRADSIVWAVTFLAVVVLDVSYGLIVGVITALFSITWRMHNYRGTLLKEHEKSGVYLTHSKKLKLILSSDLGDIVIFRFASPLFFATKGHFERDIATVIAQYKRFYISNDPSSRIHLVIDCSSMCFVDVSGSEALNEVIKNCRDERIDVLLAAAPDVMLKTLDRSGVLEQIGYCKVFPSIQDAVNAAKSSQQENLTTKDLPKQV